MNNKIMKISAILIVILSIALIVLFIDYFLRRNINNTSSEHPSQVSGDINKTDNNKEPTNISGDTIELNSGEYISGDETNNLIDENNSNSQKDQTSNDKTQSVMFPNTIIDVVDNNSPEPVISSNTETSNQEKQQVLDEIDSALQGLLEAVGKVPTVDESKLDASLGSEVQP